jgi:hypothetical protein
VCLELIDKAQSPYFCPDIQCLIGDCATCSGPTLAILDLVLDPQYVELFLSSEMAHYCFEETMPALLLIRPLLFLTSRTSKICYMCVEHKFVHVEAYSYVYFCVQAHTHTQLNLANVHTMLDTLRTYIVHTYIDTPWHTLL